MPSSARKKKRNLLIDRDFARIAALLHPEIDLRSQKILISFFARPGYLRDLHSFPTRRSSDLNRQPLRYRQSLWEPPGAMRRLDPAIPVAWGGSRRSEEHTSELQSHSDIVCRLLLEKKNGICL